MWTTPRHLHLAHWQKLQWLCMTFSWVSKLPVEGVWSQVFYTPDVHIQQCSCSEDSLAGQTSTSNSFHAVKTALQARRPHPTVFMQWRQPCRPDVHIQQCSCSEDSLALQLVPVHNDDGKTTFKHLICCIFIWFRLLTFTRFMQRFIQRHL